jgi:hypothetical protein
MGIGRHRASLQSVSAWLPCLLLCSHQMQKTRGENRLIPRKARELEQTLEYCIKNGGASKALAKSIFVDVRQCIEASGTRRKFKTLNMFCDLSVHDRLDRTGTVVLRRIASLPQFSEMVLPIGWPDILIDFFSPAVFSAELQAAVKEFCPSVLPKLDRSAWTNIVDHCMYCLVGASIQEKEIIELSGSIVIEKARQYFGAPKLLWCPYRVAFGIMIYDLKAFSGSITLQVELVSLSAALGPDILYTEIYKTGPIKEF